jgi:uncharacterized membrane protein
MKKLSTKRLCRAGVIAALYAALTYAFAPVAFGPFQLRPAEALCILPLFFPEAIPALWIGCMLSNLFSPFFLYDVVFGALATLLAATCTYFIGKKLDHAPLKILFGGFFPVIFNTLIIPFIIVFLCGGDAGYESAWIAYALNALSIFATEAVFVYGLGTPLYFAIEKLIHKQKQA